MPDRHKGDKVPLPRTMPGFIELGPEGFVYGTSATVAEWRAAKAFSDSHPEYPAARRSIIRMIRLAELCGVPDDIPLWPRLKALANANVTLLVRH